MLMTARALSQSYFLEQYKGLDNFRVRDSLQVLNIASIEKELSTNEKIIYWAHDMHVQKKANSAGGFLHEKYNNGYINLGFLLGTGKFTALDKETSKLNSNNVLTPIKCNALENIMSTYKYPVLLLKNRDAYDNPYLKNNLYNKILTKRSIGGLDKNNQFRTLSDNEENTFDFLIYIKNSNPSQLIN